MKITCLLGTLVFGLFTFWQFNDRDQYGTQWWQAWVAAYGLVAILSLVTAFRPLPRALYLLGMLGALGAAAWRIPQIEWDKTVLYNETNPAGNESGGLLIVAAWLAFLAWKAAPKSAAD